MLQICCDSAATCNSQLHFCREIGNFLPLQRCSPLKFCSNLRLVWTRLRLTDHFLLSIMSRIYSISLMERHVIGISMGTAFATWPIFSNSLLSFCEKNWCAVRYVHLSLKFFFFLKMGHSRPLFFYFRLFYKQLTVNKCSIKVADDWIRTQVLWCRKRPLCQLRHNHFPICH